jgi:tetratricopeptide (TPR) repeat protein
MQGRRTFPHRRGATSRLWLIVWALLAGSAPELAFALERYPEDQRQFDLIASPDERERLVQGEKRAIAGDLEEALRLFNEGVSKDPDNELVARRKCEALVALGRRAEAIDACRNAWQIRPSAMTFRAFVRSYFAASTPSSASQLGDALALIAAERQRKPDSLWVYMALSEVAEEIGDRIMLETSARELLRIAPNDPATQKVLGKVRSPWWVIASWYSLLLVAAGTLAHGIWRFARDRSRTAGVIAASFGVAAAVFVMSPPVQAQVTALPPPGAMAASPDPLRDDPVWKIDDDLPWSNIPGEGLRNRSPLQFGYWLQEIGDRGVKASKQGDHERALKYFKALTMAVPDSAVGYGKMCEECIALDNRDLAILACAGALVRENVVLRDYINYVHAILSKHGPLTAQDKAPLPKVIQHIREDSRGGESVASELECEIALKERDEAGLLKCSSTLAAAAPNNPKALTYAWALAMVRGRYIEAYQIVRSAKAKGMAPAGVQQMERETLSSLSKSHVAVLLAGISVLLAGAAIAVLVLMLRQWRSSPARPAPATPEQPAAAAP